MKSSATVCCSQCSKAITIEGHQLRNFHKSGRAYCSRECGLAAIGDANRRKGKTATMACFHCRKEIVVSGKALSAAKSRSRAYCSPECSAAAAALMSSVRMAETNKRHASKRMKERNPMMKPSARAKMAGTLRAIGHQPRVRGGKGHGLTVPQSALLTALGPDWTPEFVIKTGNPRMRGLATHYTIDIAHLESMIAVEVDGGSHYAIARRKVDDAKEELLRGRGWTVLRFSNEEVTERLAACVQTVLSTTSRSKERTPTSLTGS